MAGLCEGGNEPPGSLKAMAKVLRGYKSNSTRSHSSTYVTSSSDEGNVMQPRLNSADRPAGHRFESE
ncbi:hypothetical protein ANN_21916 [Periplaneta americana]|uniref:Uncharacterized protein n=1 Tax=Periplaneta americana TaxID=6978 RepID=A0ABQ8S7P5_PERAM|nr:hypothetical protein ANN_21916 [Periplaneta americana]